jgi:hypothetical protein
MIEMTAFQHYFAQQISLNFDYQTPQSNTPLSLGNNNLHAAWSQISLAGIGAFAPLESVRERQQQIRRMSLRDPLDWLRGHSNKC